jgi:hypothetical protein
LEVIVMTGGFEVLITAEEAGALELELVEDAAAGTGVFRWPLSKLHQ